MQTTSLLLALLMTLVALPKAWATEAGSAPEKATNAEVRPVERIVVTELTTHDIEPRFGVVVTGSLIAELRKLDGVIVIGIDEVRAMLDLEAQKQLAGCADDSCLAEITSALGADTLVVGSLSRIGDENVFGIRRIDQRAGAARGQIDERLKPANGEEFLAAVGPSVKALFPEHDLKPGKTRGVAPELALRLNPPPLPPWTFWTGVAVTGASLVATGVSAANWANAEGGLKAFDEQSVAFAKDGGIADGAARQALVENADAALFGTAVAAAVSLTIAAGTGVIAAFVDWDGANKAVVVEVQ